MPRLRPILLFSALLAIAPPGDAEPVVVVSAASSVVRLERDEVVNIFLGRYRRLSTGAIAQPIDQPERSPLRAEFYRRLVNKNVNEIDAYWSRLVFSGKTAPPMRTVSSQEVAAQLADNPEAIGYLERSQIDRRFRIVMEFPR